MSRRTQGIRTGAATALCLLLFGLFLAVGCTQQERTTAARSAAQVAAASVTTTAAGQSATTVRRSSSGVKPNGRGGLDSTEARKAALARLHYMRDHMQDVMKPFRPTSQPTTQRTITTIGR